MKITENVPLAPMTTLNVGGPARFFVEANTTAEVTEAVAFSRSRNLPLFVLGGGSNVVISDAGWPGLALKIGVTGINHRHGHDEVVFEAGAGEDWDKFVGFVVTHNCAGIECLSGIPGSVGGTPVQNVGAYGQEVSQAVESVLALDLRDGEMHELSKEECGFGYRTSIFNTSERGRYVILQVNYTLHHGGAAYVAYADLKKYFAGWSMKPTLADVRDAVRKIRSGKGMLLTPGDGDCRSVGSFFKNPILSEEQYQALKARASAKNLQIPNYPALDAQKKVSAAWLVEHSGFSRGYGHGHVGLSRKHALAIVNRGNAIASEIIAFKDAIQQRVEDIWGVVLEAEPVFVGF